MHSLTGRLTICLLAVAATALVACGGGDDGGASASAAPAATQAAAATSADSVGVTLTEWGLEADASSIEAGEVTFAVTNDGAVPHELVVVRSDADATALPVAAGQVDESGLDVVGRTGLIQGGASDDITFTLSAGSYVLICNIPAHYGLGMTAAFTVE